MAISEGRRHISGLKLPPIQQYLLYDAIDRSPALIFVADDDMSYLAVNQQACDVLGYSREELLSLRVTDIAIAAEAPTMFEEMMQQRAHEGDIDLRTKDGTMLPFIYEASEVRVADMQYWVSIGFVNSRVLAKVEQLEGALLSRIGIEQAKGVLMGRHGVDAATAFEAIRRASRADNTHIEEFSRRVLEEPITPAEIERHLNPARREPAIDAIQTD
jgi:PAS domain S-box-containing protein